MINSFVHTIMYSYYGLTVLGVEIKMKLLITMVQMIQFLVVGAQAIYCVYTGYVYWPATICWISLALMVQMIVMFGNFCFQERARSVAGGGGKAAEAGKLD